MLSTDLIQGRSYQFEVLKDLSTRKFFKVRTEDGVEFTLPKFKFQQNAPLPDFIDCYVKSLLPLSLGQDISHYLNDFYEEGKDYDFFIKAIKTDPATVYELEDKHDLCFKLYNAPDTLTKGSRIKCKILRIQGVNVTLKYVGTLATKLPLEFLDIEQWLDLLGIRREQETYLKLLEMYPEFASALSKYDASDPSWIIDVIQTVSIHITEWLIQCKDDRTLLSKTLRRLKFVERLALLILEESDYLRNCNPEQRTMLQSRLSNYVELFTQYGVAASKILDKTYSDFIDKMFHRLKEAGYLYRPKRQFRIMMTILKLRPEMINSRMGELFEALHNWELSNWQSEPFRSALVQQLQIFIEGNSSQINLLPAHDSSEDNKTIIRMILAIAVQSILATDKDNIDLRINKARLYRYISYLNPGNVNVLLEKGTESLLGIERSNEFSWNDIEHPTLLITKTTFPWPENPDKDSVVKTYSTSKATVHLRANSLHIIAKNANPEMTVVPNNLLDWLNPKISLDDQAHIQNVKKSKDLSVYGSMWEDIRWAIFGHEQTPGHHKEKSKPFGGEDVRVLIDGMRILPNGNERQRLQFHCTICDDLYAGEGWMPCDGYHMLGWLSYRDIPGNYDGTIRFAQSENGTPLLYNATVIRHNDSLQFSMKSQIDDYLLESLWPGVESVAIVTHFDRLNNAWLCLSELGCTFKVPCDESTASLCEGSLVRVKYIEPDHSSSLTRFFMGELSSNQEDVPTVLKKSECLTNLMQGMGELDSEAIDENTEVVEVEEVMSREELLELIFMLQRCAYSESEYIKAFNYLGLATILCRLADAHAALSEITAHMELLKLLQDFGKNQKIDLERLDEIRDKVIATPMLERIFTRLKIVADLEINESAEWLWRLKQNPRNETEGRLASLVLSYNMLPREMESSRKDILKEISTLLNVNSTTPSSKYYGDESQTIEFKSSLIYSSQGGCRADVKTQLHEITHVICGFMNARGGKLFIGVNDSGYESGLQDDLVYRQSHGLKATIDGMIVDLQNYLDRTMPPHAKDHWEISSDPESKKGVIVVNVLPVEQPVELDGIIYVRSSSTTKPRLNKERETFIKSRSHNYRLLMKLWGVGNEHESQLQSAVQISEDIPNPTTQNVESEAQNSANEGTATEAAADTQQAASPEEKKGGIHTGKHRGNVLHSYDPDFSTPSLYAYFMQDHKVRVTFNDAYIDYEPECLLALAVKEREKGHLILTHVDNTVSCLPLEILSGFQPNETRALRDNAHLTNVNIAGENDYLLTILKASYGAIFYRLDSMSNLRHNEGLADLGETLCDNQHKIIIQEIVTQDKIEFFDADSINKERRFFGVPLPMGDGTLTEEERIEELLRPVLQYD